MIRVLSPKETRRRHRARPSTKSSLRVTGGHGGSSPFAAVAAAAVAAAAVAAAVVDVAAAADAAVAPPAAAAAAAGAAARGRLTESLGMKGTAGSLSIGGETDRDNRERRLRETRGDTSGPSHKTAAPTGAPPAATASSLVLLLLFCCCCCCCCGCCCREGNNSSSKIGCIDTKPKVDMFLLILHLLMKSINIKTGALLGGPPYGSGAPRMAVGPPIE